MASLTKRCRHKGAERESCSCTWYLRRREGGRDVYTPVGADRAEAERHLRRLDVKGETVAEAVDLWLDAKGRAPKARANSLHAYRSRAKHVKRSLGHVPVASLRPHHLMAFVDDLLAAFSPAHARSIYHLLTATLRHARRRGVIKTLPLPDDGPGIPTPEERVHELTLAEVDEIIARMPGKWGNVAELVYVTGLRWAEAVAIEPGDVDGDVLFVRQTADRYGGRNDPKTRSGKRMVPLSPRAREILSGLDLPVGGSYQTAYETLVKAMGDLHKPGMGWHSIRAAHSTLLDVAGISLREAAARMGHGHRTAQTLGYRVRSETGDAEVIDLARARHARGGG